MSKEEIVLRIEGMLWEFEEYNEPIIEKLNELLYQIKYTTEDKFSVPE